MSVTDEDVELTFDNVLKLITTGTPKNERNTEFYAVAHLLASGELTKDEQKKLGEACVKRLENDHWWRSNGGFNDD